MGYSPSTAVDRPCRVPLFSVGDMRSSGAAVPSVGLAERSRAAVSSLAISSFPPFLCGFAIRNFLSLCIPFTSMSMEPERDSGR